MLSTSPVARLMTRVLPAVALLLFAAPPLYAQGFPYTGVVIEDQVEVRAGAGRSFYDVGQASAGTLVTVDEVLYGWHKVSPPPGVFSYISKGFVNATGDGGTGTVNRDRARVKAASVDGPGESFRQQIDLTVGDKVTIVGEDGSYYKIVPPQGAYVYLPPGSVRRATKAEIAAAAQQAGPEPVTPPADEPAPTADVVEDAGDTAEPDEPTADVTGPVEPIDEVEPVEPPTGNTDTGTIESPTDNRDVTEITDGPITEPTGTETTDATEDATQTGGVAGTETGTDDPIDSGVADLPTDTAAKSGGEPATTTRKPRLEAAKGMNVAAQSEQLKRLEARLAEAGKQPLEQQPLGELLTAYRLIEEDSSLTEQDQQLVALRIAVLERNVQLVETLRKIDAARNPADATADAAEGSDETEAETEAEDEAQPDPVRYDAMGRLLASRVYDGNRLPRMFRLIDPTDMRTLAYVRPGGEVQPLKHLGRFVGIVGSKSPDPGLKLQVIEVERIDLLEAQD